jgi:signal transduction histidine kinase/ligand-binding sensor domain-containing protein
MWFGTEHGLNRYDGYEFTVYKTDPGDPTTLLSDSISSILQDRTGNFWVGTSGGVHRLDQATGTMDRSHPLWGRGQIFCLFQDSTGILWVGHWTGLFAYDGTTGEEAYRFAHNPAYPDDPQGLSNNVVRAITEDEQGNLWFGTDAGLDRMNRETGIVSHFRHDPEDATSLSDNTVLALHLDRQGGLWVGTNAGGLNRFDPASETFVHYQHDPKNAYSLGGNSVHTILEDNSGLLWVGTDNGLYQLDRSSGQFTAHRHDPLDPHSLSDDAVTALYQDRSGVLWIGTINGLNRFNRRASQFTTYRDGPEAAEQRDAASFDLGAIRASALHEDPDGVLWVGTDRGLGRWDRQTGTLTTYHHNPQDANSLTGGEVNAIYRDHNDVLWIGTGWLDEFDPETETFIHHQRIQSGISSLAEDLQGNLWIGAWNDGLYRLNPERTVFEHYTHNADNLDGLRHRNIWSLLVDKKGNLWVGLYSRGIDLLEGTNISNAARFAHHEHDPDDPASINYGRVLDIYEDPTRDGILWVGVLGGGLNRFDRTDQVFTRYTQENGLPSDSVGCIVADATGFLWLQTIAGLSRFDPDAETFQNYDRYDGIPGGAARHGVCLRSQRGELFFGGPNGLYSFFPEQIQSNLHVPPIVITQIELRDRPLRTDPLPDESFQLSYRDNTITFEFAALDYTIPEKNQYAYILEGLDENWVQAGTRRSVEYRNLQPGSYVFKVKGSNNDGVWNETGVAVTFTILPPFWDTWWFQGIVALILVGSVILGYGLRVRSVEARSRQLETLVEERTHSLEQRTRESEQRRQEREALYRADAELHRYLSLDKVLQTLVDIAVEILRADKGSLLVWDDQREKLVVRASRGFQPETLQHLSLGPGEGIAGQVALSGEPIVVEDAHLDARTTKRIIEPEGIRSIIQVPINVGGGVFGVFSADACQPHAFDQDQLRLLLALAQRAALAIENAQLYEQVKELAVVQERNRLARELHDAVTQTLFSASLIAQALPATWERDREEGNALLEDLRQLNRGALAEMRTLLLELRPAALIETSMADLVRQLAEAIVGREGIPVDVSIEGSCILPPDTHVALYRIAQEALNNVVKHARASRVGIFLHCDADTVSLTITDDGKGFNLPTAQESGGFGLQGMAERAEQFGGTLTIQSTPGKGTTVTISVEISQDWLESQEE